MPIQRSMMVVLHLSTRASQRNRYKSFWHLALSVPRTLKKTLFCYRCCFSTGNYFGK